MAVQVCRDSWTLLKANSRLRSDLHKLIGVR
jgi:hypothetical protein